MEQNDFNERLAIVDMVKKQSDALRTSIKSKLDVNSLITTLNSLLDSFQKRDDAYEAYLNLLNEFNFGNNILASSDVFPGIRTISDTVDYEELSDKSNKLKELSSKINNANDIISTSGNSLISQLKGALGDVSELLIQEDEVKNQIEDALNNLESPYDILSWKSAT